MICRRSYAISEKTAKKIDEGVQVGSVACWQHGTPSCTMTSGDRSTCSTSPREIVPASIWLRFHLEQICPWNGIEMGHIALNCKCRGGCASFVQSGLLLAFNLEFTCETTVTKSCRRNCSRTWFSNKTMPFAILKSNNAGWPSPKAELSKKALCLQFHGWLKHNGGLARTPDSFEKL